MSSSIVSQTALRALAASLLILTVACGGRGTGASTSSPNSSPATQSITVSVSPLTADVLPGATQQYTATVTGASNTAVTWSAGGVQGGNATVGTINASGVYTAPATIPTPSNITITATSAVDSTKSGTATATIHVHHDNQDFQNGPIKLGASGGNKNDQTTSGNKIFCCSGTLGSLVSRGGNFYVLSNNHVLDKADQGVNGDPISHPGLADTDCGRNADKIVANLSQSAPLKTSNVDAAIAQIVPGQVDTAGTILDLAGTGQPAAPSATIAAPAVNQPVAKSGDATGLTCSSVVAINALVRVSYSTSCQGTNSVEVTFNNQVAVSGGQFSSSGDSGSLIVTSDTARPVALLYAGSDTTTVGSPISDVLTALKDPNTAEVPKMVGGADHPVACPAATQSQVVARQKTTTRLPDSETARATAVKNLRATEFMQDPAVSSVEVGQSDDNPAESALVLTVNGNTRTPIPPQIDGVRTKIVLGSDFRAQSRAVTSSLGIAESEVTRVRSVKERRAQELISGPNVLGVGIGASTDSTAEGAMVVFVEKGSAVSVPAEIDGVRTRIVETDRFRTFGWGHSTIKACSRK
ncbi:MAG: hypothetical protein JOZ10_11635 [Acidobacteria bacterium]|nr:hypothetical protein [Acidobacteriota bacterium]MBV9147485.1 hypothetical protein [Acidobacteriota bacterium]MBV9436056.1 hypothetical protein [Acidobacteriota bacterium]